MKSPPAEGTRRFRITVRGDAIELRGFIDVGPAEGEHEHTTLTEFARVMEPFGIVVASPVIHYEGQEYTIT